MPVLRMNARSRLLVHPGRPGAKSDAAKLQHSVLGFAVEACSEFRQLIPSYAALGVLGRRMSCWKVVPKHVYKFLKPDSFWRTHYAHLARHRCVPRTPCGTRFPAWLPEKDSPKKDFLGSVFPEEDFSDGHAVYRQRGCCSGSTRE